MKRILKFLPILGFLLFVQSTFAAVAITDVQTATTSSGSPIDLTTLTVSGSNTCLVVLVGLQDDAATVTATWDQGGSNQSMGSPFLSQNFAVNQLMFKLIAPIAGNKTLRVEWSGGGGDLNGIVAAINFSGADQSTCTNSADDVLPNYLPQTNPAVVVTSSTDGATIAFIANYTGGITSVDGPQTSIFNYGSGVNVAAGYIIGGTSNTHNFTNDASDGTISYGFHVIAASGGGGGSPHGLMTMGIGN